MTYNPLYPYTRDELTARQVTPAKRSMSLAKAANDAAIVALCIQQLDSLWNNHGKLYLLRIPAMGVEIPATGSAVKLRHRISGIDLGVWRVMAVTPADPSYGHPLPVWDLHAMSDHRADRSGNTPQDDAQAATVPATATVPVTPAVQAATAGRVSTRERVSHFTAPAVTVPVTPATATPATVKRTPARASR
jgi:hypothetical protein